MAQTQIRTEIGTERLILRDIAPEDFDAVQAYAGDPAVCHFMVWGPNTPEDTHAFMKEQFAELAAPERTAYNKIVVHAETGLVLGTVELRLLSTTHRRGEFGYVYRRDAWGHGYATEAARALVAFGFTELGLERIQATCDPDNQASARVLQKTGLQLEGRMRHNLRRKGQWRDSLLFARLADD
jgi:[ribosomal protein S5]-alanine N-acetyltransferase